MKFAKQLMYILFWRWLDRDKEPMTHETIQELERLYGRNPLTPDKFGRRQATPAEVQRQLEKPQERKQKRKDEAEKKHDRRNGKKKRGGK